MELPAQWNFPPNGTSRSDSRLYALAFERVFHSVWLSSQWCVTQNCESIMPALFTKACRYETPYGRHEATGVNAM